MDRVRLGRVLGRGARLAARTAIEAVDAATSADPAQHTAPAPASRWAEPTILPPSPRTSRTSRTIPVSQIVSQVRAVQGASTAARTGALAPLKAASRALWHEVTGSFFALFAVSFAIGVWHTRANAVSAVLNDRYRFYAFCALALLFAYFSASSFMRARER